MFFNFVKLIVLQTFNMFRSLALIIDIFGNVIDGDLLEHFITEEKNTSFGKLDWTISASVGEIEIKGNLNKTGVKFSNLLSKVFEKDHCMTAYLNKIST